MFTSPACWPVSDNSVGWETSYYCFMDIRELRELEKEYKRVNKIRDDKNSDNNNELENYQQVKVKVSDIDFGVAGGPGDGSKEWVLKPTLWIRCASRCRSGQMSSNSCFWAAWRLSLSWLPASRYHQHNDHVHLRTHP